MSYLVTVDPFARLISPFERAVRGELRVRLWGRASSAHQHGEARVNMLVLVGIIVVVGRYSAGSSLRAGTWQRLSTGRIAYDRRGGGAFLLGNTQKAQRATLKALPKILQGPKYTKAMYMDLMSLLYDLLVKVRKEVDVDRG